MMADQANSYDEIPYGDNFFPYTHPIHLATLGMIFGIRPPDMDHCRVLELGCAGGGNLLPAAFELPDARFVGVDLSQRQVAEGQAVVKRLGLRNVDLRAMSITAIDASFGQFDYILCHGVFSWVPEPVRDKILAICSENLTPNGLAYISYNTYPGWHGRGMVRDMLAFHVRNSAASLDRVHRSRSFLQELVQVIPDQASSFARIIRTESEYLRNVPNSYLFHEHLEETNHPFYFHEFISLAHAKRLKFVVEARSAGMIDNLPTASRDALDEWAEDEVGREQYLDFLCNRTFRQTVLTHAANPRLDEPAPDALDSLWIGTNLTPVSASPDVVSTEPEEFRLAEGEANLSTNDPLIKSALLALYEIAPRSIRFEALWDQVLARLGRSEGSDEREGIDRDHLKRALLRCFMSSLVQLRIRPPEFATEVGDRPTSSPLARIQAEAEDRVVNLRGRTVKLDQFERVVLRSLDGSNDRAAIVTSLMGLVASGEFSIYDGEQPIEDRDRIEQILRGELNPCLQRLAARALLQS